jgi:hypothetical protein
LPKLLSRFPQEDATVVDINFALLRHAGLLADSKAALEPEYKQFLDGTGFDYRRDLDLMVASFSKSGNFFIARGRFDWDKLRNYAQKQGGSCYEQLCRMQGSTPERHISFLPLRHDTIALAVSTDDLAASRLAKTGESVRATLPSAPVWLSVPGSALRKQDSLPSGIRFMLSALNNADRVVITVDAEGEKIKAHLETTCRSQDEARVLASQLQSTTNMLQQASAHDKNLQDDALARMLVAGRFHQTERRVTGEWPVAKNLIDSLTAGI